MNRVTEDQVERAIGEFYAGGATQLEAHQWLTTVQSAPEMWEIVWNLLEKDSTTTEVKFFCSKTLHTKITTSWSDVPVEHRENFKMKLIQLVGRYLGGPKVVLTRLLMSSCSYIVHCILEQQSNAVKDFLSAMVPLGGNGASPSNPAVASPGLLLQLLTLLPEESQSAQCNNEQRVTLKAELTKTIGNVLDLIREVIETNLSLAAGEGADGGKGSEVCLDALRCLHTWIQYGVTLDVLEPLTPIILRCVEHPAVTESALEVVTAMLTEAGCACNKYPEVCFRIFQQILNLEGFLANAETARASDVCRAVYGCLLPIGEAISTFLLNWLCQEGPKREAVGKFINLVFRCSAAPGNFPTDEVYSEQAFGFWYNFQDELASLPPEDSNFCASFLAPVYRSLVAVFIKKSTYAEDYDKWSADEKESFRCYRQDIGDAFMHCYGVLGSDLVSILDAHLLDASTLFRSSPGGAEWRYLESVIHAYGHISECMCKDSETETAATDASIRAPGIFAILPLIQSTNNGVLAATTLTTIGSYADWLSLNPGFIPSVIPIVLPALTSSELASPASLALKDIARECWEPLKPFNDDILNACMAALKSGQLKSSECVRLMYPVGRILASLHPSTVVSYLSTLLSPFLDDMQMLLRQPPSPAAQQGLIIHLRMFAMLCFSLDMNELKQSQEEQEGDDSGGMNSTSSSANAKGAATSPEVQPVLLILQQLMPTLKVIVEVYANECAVVEAVCNLVRKTLNTLGDDLTPLVADLVTMTSNMYQMAPHPPVLDLSKHLVILYGGGHPTHKAALAAFLAQISAATLMAFETAPNYRELTDTLESFLLLLAQTLKKHPSLLVDNPSFNHPAVFHLAVLGLGFQETPTVKAASSFLVQFISVSREAPGLYRVVQSAGEFLVQSLLRYIGCDSPRAVLTQMAEVFLALNKKYTESLSRWLAVSMADPNFPTPLPTKTQKDTFCSSLLREKANKRRLTEVVVEFSLICRNLINTEYGRQTALNLIDD